MTWSSQPGEGYDIIIGHGHEFQRHHMEIRGVGIIDVRALFGIRAIRQQKRIEVVVQLEAWDDTRDYNRTGTGQGGHGDPGSHASRK